MCGWVRITMGAAHVLGDANVCAAVGARCPLLLLAEHPAPEAKHVKGDAPAVLCMCVH